MDKRTEQHLDNLAKKILKESSLESPSYDFTKTVMSQIETPSVSKIYTYKPLISKYGWFAIISILIALSVYLTLNASGNSNWISDYMDLSVLNNTKLSETFGNITFSRTLIYTIGALGIMLFVQIPILKHYYSKQLKF